MSGERAGYYVKGKHYSPHLSEQAKARAEYLAKLHGSHVDVWQVASHHGEAILFHRASGSRRS